MKAKYVAASCFVFKAVAILIMISIKPSSPLQMIWLYAIFMGLGVGGWTAPQSILISGNFGLTSYGAILGMVTLITASVSAFSPLIAGYVYDTTQTYGGIFNIFFLVSAIAIPLMLFVRKPKR